MKKNERLKNVNRKEWVCLFQIPTIMVFDLIIPLDALGRVCNGWFGLEPTGFNDTVFFAKPLKFGTSWNLVWRWFFSFHLCVIASSIYRLVEVWKENMAFMLLSKQNKNMFFAIPFFEDFCPNMFINLPKHQDTSL